MNKIKLLISFILIALLTACTLPPIPEPTAKTTIIKLHAQPGRSLTTDTLDHKWVNDARYFQVTEGKHRLALRFQYDRAEVMGFFGEIDDLTCLISFYYEFKPNSIYYLEARPTVTGAELFITPPDGKAKRFDFSEADIRCGPY